MTRRRPAPEQGHPQPAARTGLSTVPAAFARLVAVAGVAGVGAAVLTVTASATVVAGERLAHAAPPDVRTTSADPTAPAVHHPPAAAARPRTPAEQTVKPATEAAPVRTTGASRSSRPRHPARPTPTRWLPTGTGMWIYQWHRSDGGNARGVVRRAEHVGLSTLYLRTGSSHDGFTGASSLRSLLHATRGSDVRVVAWDFPELHRPVHDAMRLVRAARLGRGSTGPHVAAVAPDIETPAEGTYNAAWRVRAYLSALRRHLPAGVGILSAVPWPSRYRIADYPYGAVAGRSDALVPMAYWYDNAPRLVTHRSMAFLRRYHRPVQPVGQGYDGRLDVPSLPHNNLSVQVPNFFRAAHREGARAVSIWSWQAAPSSVWRALHQARRLFPARH